jgi:hypothetical protein
MLVKQLLIKHVRSGEWLDLTLGPGEVLDEAAMRSWGDSRTCPADLIRDILRGRLVADPDPHGVRLRGVRISGRLDLEDLTTNVNLELRDCFLEEGVLARGARLAAVALTRCHLEHPVDPPLDAVRLTCSALDLSGARISGHAAAGAVNLRGAHIDGSLECDGACLCNDTGPALRAEGLQVGQNINLRDGFTATRTTAGGASQLAARPGAVRLTGARIGGGLDCTNAHLRSDSGPALSAEGLQVGLVVFLRRGFTATGTTDAGAIHLAGAHIGGSLECYGQVSLRNDSGPALSAFGLQVGQNIVLYHGFTATAAHTYGAVYLGRAHIDGNLDCRGAQLLNDSGPALSADSVQVGQTVLLNEGFTAKAAGAYGAVYLRGAHVGGSLDCDGAWLANDSGPALIADGVQVGQDMRLSNGFDATGGGAAAAVNLTGARVDGTLAFNQARLEHTTDPRRRLAVDGLTYTGVPQPISEDWLDLIRHGTPGYAAQPYQQLAAGYRALGDDRQARKILMAQRDDELHRTQPRPRWSERAWGKITKYTLGYGYQPWKALLFLAGVLVLSCLLALVLGARGALAQTDKTATPGRPCTVIQQLSVGLDLNLPVGTSVARAGCDLTKDPASATAAWLAAIGWVLRVLAWVFAALFIAGFTSAVRKT